MSAQVLEQPPKVGGIRRFDRGGVYFLAAFTILLVVWEFGARAADVLLFPTVGDTVMGMINVVSTWGTWTAFGRSTTALLIGYGLAVVLGVPAGVLIGRSRIADRMTAPYLTVLLVTPMAGIIPLLIMALGLTLAASSMLVFVFCVPMVVVNTRAAAKGIDKGQIEMGKSYLANRFSMARFIYIPGSLIGIMSGMRLALGRAIAGMVIGELLLVSIGVGGLILTYQARYQAGEMYSVIFLVVLQSWLMAVGVSWLERKATHWSPNRRK